MNRDTEVLKLQILADYYHSEFTSFFSYLFTLIIGFSLFILTVYFEGIIPIELTLIFAVIGFIVFAVGLFLFRREYHKNLDRIDKLIQQVNRGEPLPSLRELRKKR